MKRIVLGLVVGFALLLGSVGASFADAQGDFRRGWAAYQQKDYNQAAQWCRKAAEGGYAEAQYFLGWMYDHGQGVTQDYKQAVMWYRKAAEQGFVHAHYNLGLMYVRGAGVIKDYVYAHMWLNIAAANGYKEAERWRQRSEKLRTSSQIEKHKTWLANAFVRSTRVVEPKAKRGSGGSVGAIKK